MKIYNRKECILYFTKRYEYMSIEDIDLLYDISLDIFMNVRYPFRKDINENILDADLAHHPTWCLRVIQEMIDKEGISNVIGYSENGVSVTFDKTGLNQALLDEIVTEAGM